MRRVHLKLRSIEFDLKSACPQKPLLHKYNGITQTPELRANCEGRIVGPDCSVDYVDDITKLPVAILCFHCYKKRCGKHSNVCISGGRCGMARSKQLVSGSGRHCVKL
jgi:hypothetical protein